MLVIHVLQPDYLLSCTFLSTFYLNKIPTFFGPTTHCAVADVPRESISIIDIQLQSEKKHNKYISKISKKNPWLLSEWMGVYVVVVLLF